MRHAARLPPPPVFNDRRLVCLIAFCKLQFIDQSFGVCVCCFCFTLAFLCRYLYILDVCCQFASCQAILAICKSYGKYVYFGHWKLCANPSKFMQKASEIKQNGAKERSENDLGSKFVRGPSKSFPSWYFFANFWRHLGDFARHFVPQLGAKGSQNQAFWHQGALKSQKMTSWMRH